MRAAILILGIVLGLAICVWSTPSMGSEWEAEQQKRFSTCEFLGEVARDFMVLRQLGAPLHDVLDGALKVSMPESVQQVMITIIVEAYDVPMEYDPVMQLVRAVEYGKYWEGVCIQTTIGQGV